MPASGQFQQPASGQFPSPASGQFPQPAASQFQQPVKPALKTKTYQCGDLVITYTVTGKNTVDVSLKEFWMTYCQKSMPWHDGGFKIYNKDNNSNNSKVTFCRGKEIHPDGKLKLKDHRHLEQKMNVHVTTVVPNATIKNGFGGYPDDTHILKIFFDGADLTPEALFSMFEKHLLVLDSAGKPQVDRWKNPIGLFPQLARAIDHIDVEKNFMDGWNRSSPVSLPFNDIRNDQVTVNEFTAHTKRCNILLDICKGDLPKPEDLSHESVTTLAAIRHKIATDLTLTEEELYELERHEEDQQTEVNKYVVSSTMDNLKFEDKLKELTLNFENKLKDLNLDKERLTVELAKTNTQLSLTDNLIKDLKEKNGLTCAQFEEQLRELNETKTILMKEKEKVNQDILDLRSKLDFQGNTPQIVNIDAAQSLLAMQLQTNQKHKQTKKMTRMRKTMNRFKDFRTRPQHFSTKKQPVQTTRENFPQLPQLSTSYQTPKKPVWIDPKSTPVVKASQLSNETVDTLLLEILQEQPIVSDEYITTLNGDQISFIDIVCAAFDKEPSLII
jgi:hypothetical protein